MNVCEAEVTLALLLASTTKSVALTRAKRPGASWTHCWPAGVVGVPEVVVGVVPEPPCTGVVSVGVADMLLKLETVCAPTGERMARFSQKSMKVETCVVLMT